MVYTQFRGRVEKMSWQTHFMQVQAQSENGKSEWHVNIAPEKCVSPTFHPSENIWLFQYHFNEL